MSASCYQLRRERLMQQLGDNSIAIISTRQEMFRNRDADYKYRADSHFYYLTGFAEPEALAVIESIDGEVRFTLFCRPSDPSMEIWLGRRAGLFGAIEQYDANQSFDISELDQQIPKMLSNKSCLAVRFGHEAEFDQRLSQWINQIHQNLRQGDQAPEKIVSLDAIVNEMRLFKSETEIDTMRRAAELSAKAHIRAMQHTRPNKMEYAIEAEILYQFAQQAAVPAYNSIVGGGENGCILHYVDNNQALRDGDLVLIDAGAELDFYAGDITRTFPVNGRFSGEQRAIYDIVLTAQLAAIKATKVNVNYQVPEQIAARIITEGLVELGILKGEINELIETKAYQKFYMHKLGHWLGMDVHDVGAYKIDQQWRDFKAGMVLTIEPGIYISKQHQDVDPRWHSIGIRIEDDVSISESGLEILTHDAPKQIDEIEAIMRDSKH